MVPDGHIVSDDQGVRVMGDVQHAEVLHIRPVADADMVDISANHGVKPGAGIFAHDDVADHHRRLLDEAGFGNGRCDALEGADHAVESRIADRGIARAEGLTDFSGVS